MGKQMSVISTLYCEMCDFEMKIPRLKGRQREEGHIKHMYCPSCGEETAFIEEVRDSTLDFWEQWQSEQLGLSSEDEEESIQ